VEHFENVCMQVNSCSLSGVAAFFAGIPKAVIVLNSPLWCYYNVLKQIEIDGNTAQQIFCTHLDNTSLIYGTEEYLLETLQSVKKECTEDITVLCIENSCAVTLIGDDIAAIAKKAGFSCPVICLDSGGLKGDFWEGYQFAVDAYFSQVKTAGKEKKIPRTVNLLGCSVTYQNYYNDLTELKKLLGVLGYQVLTCPGCGSSVEEMQHIGQAELNIVLHEELGLTLAKKLQNDYGTPYLNRLLPYGIAGTLEWLQAIQDFFVVDDQIEFQQIEQVATKYKEKAEKRLQKLRNIWGDLNFYNVVVSAPVSIALPVAKAIKEEWADCANVYAILQDGKMHSELMVPGIIVIDGKNDSIRIQTILENLAGGLLVGCSNDRSLLLQAKITTVVCQNICSPNYDEVLLSESPYVGFQGASFLLENLWNKYIEMKKLEKF